MNTVNKNVLFRSCMLLPTVGQLASEMQVNTTPEGFTPLAESIHEKTTMINKLLKKKLAKSVLHARGEHVTIYPTTGVNDEL